MNTVTKTQIMWWTLVICLLWIEWQHWKSNSMLEKIGMHHCLFDSWNCDVWFDCWDSHKIQQMIHLCQMSLVMMLCFLWLPFLFSKSKGSKSGVVSQFGKDSSQLQESNLMQDLYLLGCRNVTVGWVIIYCVPKCNIRWCVVSGLVCSTNWSRNTDFECEQFGCCSLLENHRRRSFVIIDVKM